MIDSNSPIAQGRLPRCLRRFERLTACVLHFEADPEAGASDAISALVEGT